MEKHIFIDADACPVRDETYKVARAQALAPNGKAFTMDSIGSQIATRAIMADLRAGADMPNIGGPPPFTSRDRSQFLEALHLLLVKN